MKNIKNLIRKIIKKLLFKFDLIITGYEKKKIILFLDKLKVYYTGYDLIRVGSENDGGYLIPDINNIEACFSAGVGNNTDFEDHLHTKNIKIFLTDHSVDYFGKHNFFKKKLNVFNDDNNITLNSFLEKFVNLKKILKIDIEGDEWELLLCIREDILMSIDILVIEFHDLGNIFNSRCLKLYDKTLSYILKQFTICHLHPNTSCGYFSVSGIKVPNIVELTLVNNKLIKEKSKVLNLPHELDMKNFCNDPSLDLDTFFWKN